MVAWSETHQLQPRRSTNSCHNFPARLGSATQLAGWPASWINWPITLAMCRANAPSITPEGEARCAGLTPAIAQTRPKFHVQKEQNGNPNSLFSFGDGDGWECNSCRGGSAGVLVVWRLATAETSLQQLERVYGHADGWFSTDGRIHTLKAHLLPLQGDKPNKHYERWFIVRTQTFVIEVLIFRC